MKDGKRRRSKQSKTAAPAPVERILSLGGKTRARRTSAPSAEVAARLQRLLELEYTYREKRYQFQHAHDAVADRRLGHRIYGNYKPPEYHLYVPRAPLLNAGGNTRLLYHGTTVSALEGILKNGLQPSRNGLLGPGIYFGGKDKAELYFRSSDAGVLLECRVNLGKVYDAAPRAYGVPPGYDSVRGVPGVTLVWGGGTLLREEFIVPDKSRVSITAIWLYKGREHSCSRCAKMFFASELALRGMAHAWVCKACA